jgi:glutathione peroxidase
MFRRVVVGCVAAALCVSFSFAADEKKDQEMPKALAPTMKSLEGKPVELADYKGKVLLVVNVASKCGYTKQYDGLQKLYEKYQDKDFVVLGFPCNQFGGQEPGSSEEIATFCEKNYGVKFDMFEKVDVNGTDACDLYKYLTSLDVQPAGTGKISWNFEKFLIGKDGEVLGRYKSGTKPMDAELTAAIEKALGK